MGGRLFDMGMPDGSRHFGALAECSDASHPEWERIRDAVPRLSGAHLSGFVTDHVTEAWIDFDFRSHRFSINNQNGEWWFFVDDPTCADEVLLAVLDHFEATLMPAVARARAAGPIAVGSFRAVVFEANARVSVRDFGDLDSACRYADDAASEVEDGVVVSSVLDDQLRIVHRGTHYRGRAC
jgi:hypothetical protein